MKRSTERWVDTEPLLHDNLHLLPYMQPPSCTSTSHGRIAAATLSSAQAAAASASIHRLRLPKGLGTDGARPPIALPEVAVPFGKQAQYAVRQTADLADIGEPLVTQYLEDDAELMQRRRRFDPFAGNAMCTIGGEEGELDDDNRPRLAHACGEQMDVIAVSSRRQGTAAVGAGEESSPPPPLASTWATEATCVLPRGRRALQLAAGGLDAEPNTPTSAMLLVRSMYCLDFLQLSSGGGGGGGGGRRSRATDGAAPSLDALASTGLVRRPLHACLNPSIRAEAACLLESGQVQIFRLDRSSGRSEAAQTRCGVAAADACAVALGPTPHPHEAPWGMLEYAEHPRTLYAAGSLGLELVDLRAGPAAQPTRLLDVTGLLQLPELRAGTLAVPGRGSARGRVAPVVALSSCEHLLLVDVRAPRAPLGQWRLPMPLPGCAHAPSTAHQPPEPPPRYGLQFGRGGRSLHAIDMSTGRALTVRCDAASARGGDASARAVRGAPAGPPLVVPAPPALPLALDPDGVLCRHLHEAAVWRPGPHAAALPLAGAAVVPTGRRGPRGDDGDDDDASAGGGATAAGADAWSVAALRADGAVDVMEWRLEAEAGGASSEGRGAPSSSTSVVPISRAVEGGGERSGDRGGGGGGGGGAWASHLERFLVPRPAEVVADVTKMSLLAADGAAPQASQHQPAVDRAAGPGATATPAPAAAASRAAPRPPPTAVMAPLEAQWDEWEGTARESGTSSAPPASSITPLAPRPPPLVSVASLPAASLSSAKRPAMLTIPGASSAAKVPAIGPSAAAKVPAMRASKDAKSPAFVAQFPGGFGSREARLSSSAKRKKPSAGF